MTTEGLTDEERTRLYQIRDTMLAANRVAQARSYRDDVACLLGIIERLDKAILKRGDDAEAPKLALAAAVYEVLCAHGCHMGPTG